MLTCQYMPDVFGGAEKQCQRLSNELAQRGHRVTVLSSTQSWRVPRVAAEGALRIVRPFTLIAPDLLGRYLLFSVYWLVCVLVWGVHHRREFDVVHCHQGKFGAFVGTALARLLGKPAIVKIGNSEADMDLLCLQRKKFVGAWLARAVVRRRPTFIAISQVIRRNLVAYGCHDVVSICNGVTPQLRADSGAAAPQRCDEIGFFYHGRLEAIKRIDVLLDAFAMLVRSTPQARLHLIGDGRAAAAARTHCSALGLDDKVVFHGQQADPLAAIAGLQVFVNASRAEGFSNSLLEALLLGKVLVSTPVSGAAEAIREGENGHLAVDFSAVALAEAMRRGLTLAAPERTPQVQAVCAQLLNGRFAMPLVVDQVERLYAALLAAAPQRLSTPGPAPCE